MKDELGLGRWFRFRQHRMLVHETQAVSDHERRSLLMAWDASVVFPQVGRRPRGYRYCASSVLHLQDVHVSPFVGS